MFYHSFWQQLFFYVLKEMEHTHNTNLVQSTYKNLLKINKLILSVLVTAFLLCSF